MGSIEGCSSFSTSFLHPSKHVGEHHPGSSGWRALGGSGGIAGGCTTTGGKGGCTLAQAASSDSSPNSISLGTGRALGLLVDDFGDGLGTALLLGSGELFGVDGGSLQAGHLFGVLAALLGELEMGATEPPGLRAEGQQRQRKGCGGGLEGEAADHAMRPAMYARACACRPGHFAGCGLPGRQLRM
jgi:hypothetical protein